jgi:hypothetical protein
VLCAFSSNVFVFGVMTKSRVHFMNVRIRYNTRLTKQIS